MIRLLFILFLLIFTGQSEQDPVEKGSSKPGKYFNNPIFDGADPWMIQKDIRFSGKRLRQEQY